MSFEHWNNGMKASIDRRELLQGTSAVSASLLLAANGGKNVFAAQDTGASPVPGGSLVVGVDSTFPLLDPSVSSSRYEVWVFMNIFDTLIVRTPDLEFHPGLAESWTVSEDGLTISFQLRQDVVFHDGEPLNAEAVKAHFERVVDPATQSRLAATLLGPFDHAEAIDEYTVELHFSRPAVGPVMDALSQPYLGIVSVTAAERLGDQFAREPIGTGPFRFKEWVNDEHVILERNEAYNWAPPIFDHQGPPHLEQLEFKAIKEPVVRTASLQSGETQLITWVSPPDVLNFQNDDNYEVISGHVPGQPLVYHLNTQLSPTTDINVRQAINYGVDRPLVVDAIYFGLFPPAFGPLSSSTFGYWDGVESMYPFDPEKAIQLLEEAGWTLEGDNDTRSKDGESLTLTLMTLLEPDLGVEVQTQLRDIGIELKVEQVSQLQQNEMVEAGSMHMGWLRQTSGDPDIMYTTFHSSNIPGPGRMAWGWSYYNDPELDDLIERGAAATQDEERLEIYQRAQQLVMERALILPLYTVTQILAFPTSIHGVKFEGHNYHALFNDVWMDNAE
ncbi:MAG: ABC transporter substrate-binding protein [Thermomicrobiales bacterium]|nr:ABC transporter substrate-binding protein [Thermomicrobiales bacterium]